MSPNAPSPSALRWGLVGASTIAREFVAPAIRSLPSHGIVAVCSSSPERGTAFAREQGIERSYDDLAAFLADPEMDAVYISTTNELHEPQTIAAARAGKHILCEKPLALDIAGARRMLDACADAGVVLATNHHFRNAACNRAAKAAIRRGLVGRPLAARISQAILLPKQLRGWRLNERARGAGAILDLTVHTADTLRFVLDAEIESVLATSASQTLGGEGVEDAVAGVMALSNGALACFYDAFNVPDGGSSLEIHGTEGSIVVADALEERLVGVARLRRGGAEEPLPAEESEDLYAYGLRRFAQALAGEGAPAASGLDGLRSLEAALAVRDSAASGRRICLGEDVPAKARA